MQLEVNKINKGQYFYYFVCINVLWDSDHNCVTQFHAVTRIRTNCIIQKKVKGT